MSFQFGQFRRSQLDSFLTPLKYKLEQAKIKSTISTAVTFVDNVISLTDALKPTEQDGIRAKNYYIRFRIYKKANPQTIIIKLINTNKQTDNIQNLRTIIVDAGRETEYNTYEIVIPPNNNYTKSKAKKLIIII